MYLQRVGERVARKTTRRTFFGRGAEVAFGALIGIAAGGLVNRAGVARATDLDTHCGFPGPACPCEGCQASGVCAKPCIVYTFFYASGCWVTTVSGKPPITCCDCDCNGRVPGSAIQVCGCGSDWHNNPTLCPDGNASG